LGEPLTGERRLAPRGTVQGGVWIDPPEAA